MKVAVLALQGAFIEHEQMLQRLGVETFEVRQLSDWQQPRDGLVLPGGESTVQMRLLKELGLYEPIREAILGGLPVLGTCAGMILLSEGRLGTMDIEVRRNAYGRQSYIERVLSDKVEVLSTVDVHIVAARQGNQLATAFHPELDEDTRLHELFLGMVVGRSDKE